MITTHQEHFQEIEIHHHGTTYYANGYVEYATTECIGGSYEGYAFELVYQRELCHISITDLWYFDNDTGKSIDVLYQHNYREIERIAQEAIRYEFE